LGEELGVPNLSAPVRMERTEAGRGGLIFGCGSFSIFHHFGIFGRIFGEVLFAHFAAEPDVGALVGHFDGFAMFAEFFVGHDAGFQRITGGRQGLIVGGVDGRDAGKDGQRGEIEEVLFKVHFLDVYVLDVYVLDNFVSCDGLSGFAHRNAKIEE